MGLLSGSGRRHGAYPSDEGLAIYFVDISQRKASEAAFHALAFYDQLTGLPNRQLLIDRIEHALQLCRRGRRWGALMFIDLDNFKGINDARGHDKGDILLRLVGERLKGAVRASDTVARFGGDEFVILLDELGASEGEAAAHAGDVAAKVLQAFVAPFEIAGIGQYSTPSVGLTVFGGGSGGPDDVLKRADLAMYQSKAAGRNTVSLFEPGMQVRVAARAALEAGYSSLSYLHRLPLDQLKIDRAFIRDALNERHGGAIVRTIAGLGKTLQMAVLAEGVETAEQLASIVDAGCQAYQGYLYSRPLPAAELERFIAEARLS